MRPVGKPLSVPRGLGPPAGLLGLLLTGCVALPPGGEAGLAPTPRLDPPAAATRLPASAAGFQHRGTVRPLPAPGNGVEVAYASQGRVAAGAVVQMLQPAGPPIPDGVTDPATQAALDTVLRETAQQQGPHRRLHETGRFTLPAAGPALLRCAALEGRYGRVPVDGMACAGAVSGLILQLRLTMPRQTPPVADARAFATEVATALRR
jgi:hypothetical protein